MSYFLAIHLFLLFLVFGQTITQTPPDLGSIKGCFSMGECALSLIVGDWDTEDIHKCQLKCQEAPQCNYFTFYEDSNVCHGYQNCHEFTTNFCGQSCFTAEQSCPGKQRNPKRLT